MNGSSANHPFIGVRWDNCGKNWPPWPRSLSLRNGQRPPHWSMWIDGAKIYHLGTCFFRTRCFFKSFLNTECNFQPGLRDWKCEAAFWIQNDLTWYRMPVLLTFRLTLHRLPRLWGCQTLLRAIRTLRKCVRQGGNNLLWRFVQRFSWSQELPFLLEPGQYDEGGFIFWQRPRQGEHEEHTQVGRWAGQ